jgi:hypothetical protein
VSAFCQRYVSVMSGVVWGWSGFGLGLSRFGLGLVSVMSGVVWGWSGVVRIVSVFFSFGAHCVWGFQRHVCLGFCHLVSSLSAFCQHSVSSLSAVCQYLVSSFSSYVSVMYRLSCVDVSSRIQHV